MALIIFTLSILLMMASLILFPEVTIFKKKLKTHWIIILIGALLMLVLNQVQASNVLDNLFNDSAMNPLKLIVLFIFLTILSLFLDEVGFFKYLALLVVNKLKGSQTILFISIYALASILTIFTSNDIIILTLTPFIIYFSKNIKINPIPYLCSILVAANTWSIMLIIGNPTNIYLASSIGLDFITYMNYMFLPGLTAGIVGFILMYLIFRKDISKSFNIVKEEIKLKQPKLVLIALFHLILCIVLMALSNYINLEMWLICLILSISLTIIIFISSINKKSNFSIISNSYKRAPWDFIPMILGMYILILGIETNGYTVQLADFLNQFDPVVGYGLSSHLISNLTNNQPMSMLFASVIQNQVTDPFILQKTLASIIGSNTAVLLSPFGALAGLMWYELIKQYNINFKMKNYFIIMIPVGLIVLFSTLLVLSFVI